MIILKLESKCTDVTMTARELKEIYANKKKKSIFYYSD
jgi:hypothetical protein